MFTLHFQVTGTQLCSVSRVLHTREAKKLLRNLAAPDSVFILKLSVKKGRVRPRRDHESPERQQKYSSTLCLTSALD